MALQRETQNIIFIFCLHLRSFLDIIVIPVIDVNFIFIFDLIDNTVNFELRNRILHLIILVLHSKLLRDNFHEFLLLYFLSDSSLPLERSFLKWVLINTLKVIILIEDFYKAVTRFRNT